MLSITKSGCYCSYEYLPIFVKKTSKLKLFHAEWRLEQKGLTLLLKQTWDIDNFKWRLLVMNRTAKVSLLTAAIIINNPAAEEGSLTLLAM